MKGFNLHIKKVLFSSWVLLFLGTHQETLAQENSSFGNLFGSASKKSGNKVTTKTTLPKTLPKKELKEGTSKKTAPSFSEKQTEVPAPSSAAKSKYPEKSYREAVNRKLARPNELSRSELAQLPQIAVHLSALRTNQFENNLNYLLDLKKAKVISLETVVIHDLKKAQEKLKPEYQKWFKKSFPKAERISKKIRSNDKYYKGRNASKKLSKLTNKYTPTSEEINQKTKDLPLVDTLKRLKDAGFTANKKLTLKNHKKQTAAAVPSLIYRSSKKEPPLTFGKNTDFKQIIDTNGNLLSEQLGSSVSTKKTRLFDKRVSPQKQKQISTDEMGTVFTFRHYEDELPFWLK